MAKYKVGNKVRVRRDLRRNTDYFMADHSRAVRATNSMIKLAGKIVTISKIASCGHYEIEEDPDDWCWADEMFESPAKHEFKVGQKYRVGNGRMEEGNIIQITNVEGDRIFYRTVVGGTLSDDFDDGSSFARSLTPVVDDKIIITTDGVTVTAKRISDGKTATAKCSPGDEFNFEFGAKLAFDRLMRQNFKVGDIVIADADAPYGITTNGWRGTVVDCSDHRMIVKGDDGSRYPVDTKFFNLVTSAEDAKPEFKVGEFVKVIGESYGHHFPIGSIVEIKEVCDRFICCYGFCDWGDGRKAFGTQNVKLESVEKL